VESAAVSVDPHKGVLQSVLLEVTLLFSATHLRATHMCEQRGGGVDKEKEVVVLSRSVRAVLFKLVPPLAYLRGLEGRTDLQCRIHRRTSP